jgi:cytoskeletal protein CcmA (bactofilin family)
MWNKESEAPPRSTSATQWEPPQSTLVAPATVRSTSNQPARSVSCLGANLEIKGKISGDEDLQIDGKVEGSVEMRGHRLTLGSTGKLNSEVHVQELIVYRNLTGSQSAAEEFTLLVHVY